MAGRNPQTAAKRAREQALREKKERKRQRRADAAAARLAAPETPETAPLDQPDDDAE
ncbi:MAG: hypothetical protein ABUS54_11075 [Actinomycetota bacterium]